MQPALPDLSQHKMFLLHSTQDLALPDSSSSSTGNQNHCEIQSHSERLDLSKVALPNSHWLYLNLKASGAQHRSMVFNVAGYHRSGAQ